MKTILKKFVSKLGISKSKIYTFYPINIKKIRALFLKTTFKKCGWGIEIDKFVNIQGKKNLTVGEYSVINSFVHIWAGPSGVYIGDRVLIASHAAITSLTHDYSRLNMRFGAAIDKSVIIKDDVWIGSHAVILPGITIGEGAVIGAGAIVTSDIPDYAIAIGIPAKVIKYRANCF
jgi:maltose O-acetyltransferase